MFSFSQLPRPCLMGIVNITPDSFSDGTLHPATAAAHARALVAQGAHILDLGAEASSFFRPGIAPTPPEEQLRRLRPVLQLLTDLPPHILLSIDTRSAQVARELLSHSSLITHHSSLIINDISAGTHDPAMLSTVAQHNAAIILMHITPTYPATPAADDGNILETVSTYLLGRAAAAQAAGIPQHRIALDPGLGFGKTMPDNWRLALRSSELAQRLAPYPLVLGASRKRFLETPIPADAPLPPNWHAHLAELTHRASETSHPRDPASAALARAFPLAIHRLHNLASV